MPDLISTIPLNDIVKDWRVQEYVRKRSYELAKKRIQFYHESHGQVQTCHAWLLCLHHQAINRLQDKYGLSKPQFMVLVGAYLLKYAGKNGFKAMDLSSTLLAWEYNRVYRHLKNLSEKGYIRIEISTYSNPHRYWLCSEGEAVIRAFNQHYWRVFREVSEKIGGFPEPPW
jgi:DNA-binding MarR family transcriptional regulator